MEFMSISHLIFLYFAVMIIASSILVITRKSPIHSVLWMLFLFVHIAALYLFLNAEFLAVIQIIIYAGAILVLFLFVIMLLNLRNQDLKKRFQNLLPLSLIIGAALTTFFIFIFMTLSDKPIHITNDINPSKDVTKAISDVLYTDYLLPFEIASLILLVAMIGAVVLAKKKLI